MLYGAGKYGSDENYDVEIVDDDVVTQVYRSPARNSITKVMGDLMPLRMIRSNSEHRIPYAARESAMVVGVQVEKATVEASADSEEPVSGATVHAPNSIRRRASSNALLGTAAAKRAWLTKAKDLTQKIRQRSKTMLSPPLA